MIGHVMMYLLLVSLVVSAAAWIADEGLRRAGVQTRWLWMLALAAGPLLLLAGAVLPATSVSAVAGGEWGAVRGGKAEGRREEGPRPSPRDEARQAAG